MRQAIDLLLFEAPHTVQDVKILPALDKIDTIRVAYVRQKIWISYVYKRNVLKNKTAVKTEE